MTTILEAPRSTARPSTNEGFFAIDRRAWARVCALGFNTAVAYLVIACGTGGDKSKRSGLQCRAPAVRGSSVRRMHGAGGGAPRGNRNAVKHGEFAAETLALKREIRALAQMARTGLSRMPRRFGF
jgi:hypothetical protein